MSVSNNNFTNPSAASYTIPAEASSPHVEITRFHNELSGYTPSPLISLPELAQPLKSGKLFIKDERTRFGLPSFKPLGIAWAMRNALIAELSEGLAEPIPADISLLDLAVKAREAQITLVTATDGKLGRIVAKLGKSFNVESIKTRIFVAEDLDEKIKAGIKAEGAEVIVVEGDFETAIREAWLHSVSTDGVLISLEAEENYEEFPAWVVEGYSTIFHELDEQLSSPPDVLIVPVGVGGLAQAAVSHYKSVSRNSHRTQIVTVEAKDSACLLESLKAGNRLTIKPQSTILGHLNYEAVSQAAWEALKDGVDISTAVDDESVVAAVSDLQDHGFGTGACGGAVLAGLRSILGTNIQEQLNLNEDSQVVLICTDSAGD